MIQAIRTTAQVINKALNTCLNPTCLHSTKVKGCECCKKNHGTKKTTKKSGRSRAKRR